MMDWYLKKNPNAYFMKNAYKFEAFLFIRELLSLKSPPRISLSETVIRKNVPLEEEDHKEYYYLKTNFSLDH